MRLYYRTPYKDDASRLCYGGCDDTVREESFTEISACSRPSEFEARGCEETLAKFTGGKSIESEQGIGSSRA